MSEQMAERASSRSDLRLRLRNAGLRATTARVGVLACLEANKAPLTHAEVYEQLAEGGSDRATVYRNLIDLADAGFLKRYDRVDHVWRFELVRGEASGKPAHSAQAHPHFVCSDCGAVECLPASAVSLASVRGGPKALQQVSGLEIQVRGRCDQCS